MIELVLGDPDLEFLAEALAYDEAESCAIGYTTVGFQSSERTRLLLRDIEVPDKSDYSRRDAASAELTPTVVARAAKRARRDNLGIVFFHSHPGTSPPRFSMVDDEGEEHLAIFMRGRVPHQSHLAVVISGGGVSGRVLGAREPIRIVSIGANRTVLQSSPSETVDTPHESFDRQVRAFGIDGQQRLQGIRVAIVGLGGTGSIVAQQLSHLGVLEFCLVDPDTIDGTNLNRTVGAMQSDVGAQKVEVAARHIRATNPKANVRTIAGDVVRQSTALELVEADVIFGCTDSHGSRAVLQQLSYQYLIPCIDMGSVIARESDGTIKTFGRVQLLAPGLACLTCTSVLDPMQVRRDMMNDYEKRLDPYWIGDREPAPAVISLNGVVASLAVSMLLSMVSGVPMKGRHLLYNLGSSTLRAVKGSPTAECFICSKAGVLARGNSHALYARQD